MKKILMLMTILSFALKVAWAENTDVSRISNTIYIENFSVKVGEEKTVSVKMKNNIAPTGFQFDIVLPDGISIKTEDDFYCIDLSTARTTSRKTDTFSSARRSDGSIRVICSSTNNYTFSGNDGEVATIVFKVNSNVTPGNYTLTLKNIELSEANGTAHPVGVDVKSTITVTADTENEKNIIASGECGENATWTLDDEGLLTISGTGAMTNFGKAPWYDYRSSIKNVQIENGITTVRSNAFYGCSVLTSIVVEDGNKVYDSRDNCNAIIETSTNTLIAGCQNTVIPNSVTSIGSSAFEGCSALTDITIPNSVASIGNYAFRGCSGLTSITIPNSVTSIGSGAFYDCSSLTSITIPNSVTSIGRGAFYDCSSLTSITIPNSVTSIGSYAFRGCSSLTSITIPNSVTSIGSNAFRYCSVLTSIVVEDGNKVYDSRDNCNAIIETSTNTLIAGCQNTVIPNSVTSIGSSAFEGCSALTDITIPNSVASIGNYAFRGCSSLTSITIPNSVTSIGSGAFYDCSSLTSITIPNSVTSIGSYAFYGCEKLTSVTNYSTTPQQIASNTFSNYGTLHVVKGAGEAYANADYWKNFTIVEDATYATIIASGECGENATWTLDDEGLLTISGTGDMYDFECRKSPWFENFNENIKNVVISEGITSIGKHAFDYMEYSMAINMSGCNSLETVSIPRSVTTIGESAFFCCTRLKSIHIPNTTVNFDGKIFGHNHNLSAIEVEEGHPTFCSIDGVLYTNDKKELVRVPGGKQGTYTILDGVTTVSDGACGGCVHLSEINIPSTVTNIGAYAFERCLALTSIEIPNSVTTMLNHAFFYCTALTSAKLPNKMVTLEESVFQYCTSLASIDIPNSVTQFGRYVFVGCSSLKSAVIPNSVVNIWTMAFYGCTNLESVVLPESLEILDRSVFKNCNNLTSVTNYSTHPQNIYDSTFSNYGTLHVVKGAGEAYANADYWKNFTIVEDAVGTEVYENTDISQMTDVLYSAEMKAKSGKQVVLPIYMKNSSAVTLFQTNVYLPDGFSFAKKANGKYAVSLIKDRLTDEDDNHVISSNVQKDGSLLILCSSQDNYTFDGKDGQVATVTIDVADDVEEGPYLIKLNNQKMVRPDNTGSNVAEYQVVLTVKNYTLGDVNDDGDIDGYDLVGISNLILGTNTDGLIRDAADVNSDGDVDGYDYVMEVNTILGTNASAAKGKNTTLTENALSALTIPTMNVTAGEQTQLVVGMECNGDVFTLVQTDIEFPEGVKPMLRNGRVVAKLAGECLGGADDHSISCVKQGSGKYRILIASQDNTGFTGKDGQLFTIGIETSKDMLPGMYDITLSNTKLVRANSTGVNPSDVTAMMVCNGTTGINGVEGDNADELLYNLNGQRVSKHAQRSVYISNGKKNVKLK